MKPFTHTYTAQQNSTSANACAQHMALIAHGLFGKVDVQWTQIIGDAGITMAFESPEDAALFATRWKSLTEEDWYRSLIHIGEGTRQKVSSSSSLRHECEIVLSGRMYWEEQKRIERGYAAVGIPDTENGDYADDAVDGLLDKLERLALHLDLGKFEFESIDDWEPEDDESDPFDLKVRLKFDGFSGKYLFLAYAEHLGWCSTGSKG
jgi:hypothetical protein